MRASNCPHSTFLAIQGTTAAYPLGIVGGAVKLHCRLEGFVPSRHGGSPRFREQSGYSGLIHRPECVHGFHRLSDEPPDAGSEEAIRDLHSDVHVKLAIDFRHKKHSC